MLFHIPHRFSNVLGFSNIFSYLIPNERSMLKTGCSLTFIHVYIYKKVTVTVTAVSYEILRA